MIDSLSAKLNQNIENPSAKIEAPCRLMYDMNA
jgi:hypothetical protein